MISEKFIDLHTHSVFSDGTFTPSEIVSYAKKLNLSAIALTDHDTTEGIDEFFSAGIKYNIETIAGIELSASYLDNEVHIVGLLIDKNSEDLKDLISYVLEKREERNIEMTKKLSNLGFKISYDEILENSKGSVITRAHYANILLKKGFALSRNEVFDKYLSPGKPGFVEKTLPNAKDCINAIKKSGGVSILAHPTLYKMNRQELEKMCENLISYGLDGIETLYSSYSFSQEKEIKNLAVKYDLKFSGGSDFHGENKKNINLGYGKGNLKVPYEFLSKLKNEAGF